MSHSRLAVAALGAALIIGFGCGTEDTATTADGVHMGADIAEVEKKLGPPISVLPNMGAELRTYKAPSGRRYMLTVEDGKVIEIRQ
jgi:hypothetical protein